METKGRVQLSDVIRMARNTFSMTLRELADAANISFSHLGKIERGESTPSREHVGALASALNMDKNYLLILAGYVPSEITLGTAQLIHEIWGNDDEPIDITPEDIILMRNNLANGHGAPRSTGRHVGLIDSELDEEWVPFIREMKRENISPEQLRHAVELMNRLKALVKQLEAEE